MKERIEYKGRVIEIEQDTDVEYPRYDYDHQGKMFCLHRRHNIGDKHDYRSEQFSGWDDFLEQIQKDHKVVSFQPLWLYDHSGLALSTGPFREDAAGWDSGQVGWIVLDQTVVDEWERFAPVSSFVDGLRHGRSIGFRANLRPLQSTCSPGIS